MFYKFVSIITVGKLFICVFKFIWVSLTTFFKIGYMKKTMKILQLLILAIFVYSCGSGGLNQSKGELIGVKGKKYYPEKPYGMTLIPGGSYIMGKSDDDIASIEDAPTKTVTVRSFYMDETEITNSEYRQFVNWTRDSVLRTALAIFIGSKGSSF